MQRSVRSLLVLPILLFSADGCERTPRHPNIVVVVVDTLRADRLGCYGNRRALTPFLDELAARGTVFKNAYAASSWTIPSVASLITSRYPTEHGISAHDFTLPDRETTLAELLQSAGYWGGGYSANPGLSLERGFAQGFTRWKAPHLGGGKMRGEELLKPIARRAGTDCGIAPLPPCLLYVQYMEPHAPYQPPGVADAEFFTVKRVNDKLREQDWGALRQDEIELLSSLYDREVAAADRAVRALFEKLSEKRILDGAVVVFTADHGEEFHEHGAMSHGRALYGETVRVPLIVMAPGYARGRVVDENVSLVDVAPTVLELAGLPPAASFEGRSLVPLLGRPSILPAIFDRFAAGARGAATDAPATTAPDVIIELPKSSETYDLRRHVAAIVRGRLKLLTDLSGNTELYDLEKDPGEKAPNPPALDAETASLAAALARAASRHTEQAGAAPQRVPLDEKSKERLRALGYGDF